MASAVLELRNNYRPKWNWRRGWDSNPRYGCPYAAFRVRCFQPLSHLSARRICLKWRLRDLLIEAVLSTQGGGYTEAVFSRGIRGRFAPEFAAISSFCRQIGGSFLDSPSHQGHKPRELRGFPCPRAFVEGANHPSPHKRNYEDVRGHQDRRQALHGRRRSND